MVSQFELEERCRLESALSSAEDALDAAIQSRGGDVEGARRVLDLAQAKLDRWDSQVVQVSPAPAGMVAVFERQDGLEEHIPVSFLALHRSGRVLPYIYVGNCEQELPYRSPNFLRIDHTWMYQGEVSMGDIAEKMVVGEKMDKAGLWLW